MARNALVLFLQGRLFADQRKAIALIAAGVFLSALICIVLVQVGSPLLGAALVSGFIGGGLQPLLLKKIKFR